MNKDIENRDDIEMLITAFYKKALADDLIGHFFTEVVKINWEKHIPLICDFWESTLFQTSGYKRNPIEIHQQLNLLSPIKKAHFDRWIELFHETIDANFRGAVSDLAKIRATSIATVMQIKINSQQE